MELAWADRTSVRSMNSERSVFSVTLVDSSGRVKLGQPVRNRTCRVS